LITISEYKNEQIFDIYIYKSIEKGNKCLKIRKHDKRQLIGSFTKIDQNIKQEKWLDEGYVFKRKND